MSFIKLLKDNKDLKESTILDIESDDSELVINETTAPEEILRSNNIKIKLVTPTSFGTQISFAKKYNRGEIIELLKNFKLKFINDDLNVKEIFIVDNL